MFINLDYFLVVEFVSVYSFVEAYIYENVSDPVVSGKAKKILIEIARSSIQNGKFSMKVSVCLRCNVVFLFSL